VNNMHTVCWVDIGVRDRGAAAAFYRELFGWVYTDPAPDGYRVAMLDGRAVSGLGPAEDPGPPYWTVVVGVEDIDAAVGSFTAAGATIRVPPVTAGELGRSAVVVDPVGAPISLWQPGTQTGMQVAGEQGTFAAIELLTDRPDEASDFYRRVLGWQTGGGKLTDDGRPSLWLVNFACGDVDATVATALRLGATRAPVTSDTATVLRDPAGALFGLVA
jgi:uncharacterized protein